MFRRTLLVAAITANAICFAEAFAASPPATEAAQASSVTLSFWNIQWFPGRRPNASRSEERRQIREVHQDIAQLTSDIIGLEEVRDWQHAAIAVQPLSGFHVDVCSSFPPREGQTDTQQVAITSRLWPICAWSESWQQHSAITPPRGFAFAAYEIAPRELLLVYAVHLKSNRGEIHEDMGIRQESMRQLLAHISAMQDAFAALGSLTFIVGGDFNTAPDEPRFATEKTIPRLLANGFQWSWQNIPFADRVTLPASAGFPAASFDQIFYRNATLVRAWVSQTSPHSSDHRAVNATLKLPIANRETSPD